jgi:hypothetical protein
MYETAKRGTMPTCVDVSVYQLCRQLMEQHVGGLREGAAEGALLTSRHRRLRQHQRYSGVHVVAAAAQAASKMLEVKISLRQWEQQQCSCQCQQHGQWQQEAG